MLQLNTTVVTVLSYILFHKAYGQWKYSYKHRPPRLYVGKWSAASPSFFTSRTWSQTHPTGGWVDPTLNRCSGDEKLLFLWQKSNPGSQVRTVLPFKFSSADGEDSKNHSLKIVSLYSMHTVVSTIITYTINAVLTTPLHLLKVKKWQHVSTTQLAIIRP
jgi:hypothetical protein